MGKRKKVEDKPAPEPVVTVVPEFDEENDLLPQPASRPGSLRRVIAPAGEPPIVLGGHGIRDVFVWCEALRDWHQNKGELLTVPALFVYAGYMGSNRDEVRKHIADIYHEEAEMEKLLNKKLIRGELKTTTNGKATVVANDEEKHITLGNKGGKRFDMFGHPITAVLRWMGKNGWTVPEARKALDSMGFAGVANPTLSAQIAAGKKPDNPRGEPAQLTEEQASKLNEAKS